MARLLQGAILLLTVASFVLPSLAGSAHVNIDAALLRRVRGTQAETEKQMAARVLAKMKGESGSTGIFGSSSTGKAPVITCPENQVVDATEGTDGVQLAWTPPTATDKDGQTLRVEQTGGPQKDATVTGSDAGTKFKVTYNTTDASGVKATCSFNVTVRVITCSGEPTAPSNGAVNCSNKFFGAECDYKCKKGFALSNNAASKPKCSQSGTWEYDANPPTCEAVTCEATALNNSLEHGTFKCHGTSAAAGEACWAECNDGYEQPPRATGSRRRRRSSAGREDETARERNGFKTCGEDGQWGDGDAVQPQCVKKPTMTCVSQIKYVNDDAERASVQVEAPEASEGASVVETVHNITGALQIGQNNKTYVATGPSGTISSCNVTIEVRKRACKIPQEQDKYNKSTNLEFECEDGYESGSSCNVSCKAGYNLSGSQRINCVGDEEGASGTWNEASTQPICTKVPCTGQLEVKDGSVTCSAGGAFTVTCDAGFKLPEGADAATCDETNGWQAPSCIPEDQQCADDQVLTEGKCESCATGIAVQGACQSCPDNSSLVQKNTCKGACLPGTYSPTGHAPCKRCAKGNYSVSAGATACQQCPRLMTTAGSGSARDDACVDYMVMISKHLANFILLTADEDYPGFSMFLTAILARTKVPFLPESVVTQTALSDSQFINLTLIATPTALNFYANEDPVIPVQDVILTISSGDAIAMAVETSTARRKRTTHEREHTLISDLAIHKEAVTEEAVHSGDRSTLEDSKVADLSVFPDNKTLGIERVPGVKNTATDTDDDDGDHCRNHGCAGGSTCQSTADDRYFTCACPEGTTGRFCDETIAAGTWGLWSKWSACSATCGAGTRTRERKCLNLEGGANCTGGSQMSGTCTVVDCPTGTCPSLPGDNPHMNCTDLSNGGQNCTVTCPDNQMPQPANASFPSVWCSVDTNFEWMPSNNLQKCQEMQKPDSLGTTIAAALSGGVCPLDNAGTEAVKAQVKTAVPTASSDATDVAVASQECSSSRRRRKRATTNTITLTINIPLLDASDLDIAGYYSSGGNTISSSLLELVNAIDALEITAESLATNPSTYLDVTVNGQTYTVDANSVVTDASVTCSAGYTATNGFCTECATGTRYDSGWCVYCEVGYYQSQTAQTSCTACQTGYTTAETGSTSSTDCIVDSNAATSATTEEEEGNSVNVGLAVGLSVAAAVLVAVGTALVVYRVQMLKKKKLDLGRSFNSMNKVQPDRTMTPVESTSRPKLALTDPDFPVGGAHSAPSYELYPSPGNDMSPPPAYDNLYKGPQ